MEEDRWCRCIIIIKIIIAFSMWIHFPIETDHMLMVLLAVEELVYMVDCCVYGNIIKNNRPSYCRLSYRFPSPLRRSSSYDENE
jgi:hypothetical protein